MVAKHLPRLTLFGTVAKIRTGSSVGGGGKDGRGGEKLLTGVLGRNSSYPSIGP